MCYNPIIDSIHFVHGLSHNQKKNQTLGVFWVSTSHDFEIHDNNA